MITVTVVEAWADHVSSRELVLPDGATLADAVAADPRLAAEPVGLWGKEVPLDTALATGDRIERYRPITADPKAARRQRA